MIPKKIHYCWFDDRHPSYEELSYIKNWRYFCPDYEIKQWNKDNFPIETSCGLIKLAYDQKDWATVSQIVRLYALVVEGGIALDIHVQLIHSLDRFLDDSAFLGFETTDKLSLGIMGSHPHHPFMKKLYHKCHDQKERYDHQTPFIQPRNEVLLTETFISYGLSLDNTQQRIQDTTVFPKDVFSPKDAATKKLTLTPNTSAIQQFIPDTIY